MEQKLGLPSLPFSQSPTKSLHGVNPTRTQGAKESTDILPRTWRTRGESDLKGHTKEVNTVLKTGQALVPNVPPLCSTSHSQIPSLMHIPKLPKHAKSFELSVF